MTLSEESSDKKIAISQVLKSEKRQSLFYRIIVTCLIMLGFTAKNGLVQSFRGSCANSAASRLLISYRRLDSINRRQFTSSTLFAADAGAHDEKKAVLKKKTSMLTRASKVLSTRAAVVKAEPEKSSFIIDSNPDAKMTKKIQEDLIADYARSVSRIPTSIKAKKVVVEKNAPQAIPQSVPEVSKKYTPKYTPAPAAPATVESSFNSNSIYTNTEYKEQPISSQKVSSRAFSSSSSQSSSEVEEGEEPFENSQLTTHVTNMAFNSLEVSENTKRALSEVMNYKYVPYELSSTSCLLTLFLKFIQNSSFLIILLFHDQQ